MRSCTLFPSRYICTPDLPLLYVYLSPSPPSFPFKKVVYHPGIFVLLTFPYLLPFKEVIDVTHLLYTHKKQYNIKLIEYQCLLYLCIIYVFVRIRRTPSREITRKPPLPKLMSVTSPTSPLPPFAFPEISSPEGEEGGRARPMDLPLKSSNAVPFLSPALDR